MASRKKEGEEKPRKAARVQPTRASPQSRAAAGPRPQPTPPAKSVPEAAEAPRKRPRVAVNSIGQSVVRERAAPERPTRAPGPEPTRSKPAASARDASQIVPDEVHDRFVQVGKKFYFPDGALAFTDRQTRLTTPSENTEVIKNLLHIARAREWTAIKVTGTERFRREAWFMAKTSGLEVQGFKPNAFQHERLIRAMAHKPPLTSREAELDGQIEPPGPAERAPKAEAGKRDALLITGRLIDYGRAHFKHDRLEPMSFFVKLENDGKERVLWGVDLERALRQSSSNPQLGDQIGLQPLGRDRVKVRALERDAAGQIVGERAVDAHRNQWTIERKEVFERREMAAAAIGDATVPPKEAVKRHPELANGYLTLRGAEEFARLKIKNSEDQLRFVESVRQALSHSVARGEPLDSPRMRDELRQRRERVDQDAPPLVRNFAPERS